MCRLAGAGRCGGRAASYDGADAPRVFYRDRPGRRARRFAAERAQPVAQCLRGAGARARAAAAWRAMWAGLGVPDAVAGFELAAGRALATWRDKQFELPDY